MPTLRPAAALAILALLAGAPPAAAASKTAPRAPARFSVSHGLCKQFLDLPADLRGMVVAWTAGRYHALDRWVLEEETARRVVAAVEQDCEKMPEALFRYQVVAEVKKLK